MHCHTNTVSAFKSFPSSLTLFIFFIPLCRSLEVIVGLESNSKIFTVYVHGLLELQVSLGEPDPHIVGLTYFIELNNWS